MSKFSTSDKNVRQVAGGCGEPAVFAGFSHARQPDDAGWRFSGTDDLDNFVDSYQFDANPVLAELVGTDRETLEFTAGNSG